MINEIDVDKELIELLDVSQNEQVQSFTLECLRLFKDNNFSNALMKCDEAINIDPTAKKALFLRATLYTALNMNQRSLDDLYNGVFKEVHHPDYFMLIGLNIFSQKKYSNSLEYFDKALEVNPKYHKALYYKSEAYYALKDIKKSYI